MRQVFSNAARAELADAITSSSTSLNLVAGGNLFPVANLAEGTWFKITLQDSNGFEIVYCRSHEEGSEVLGELLRGQEGTTAREFFELASVHHGPTAGNADVWESKQDSVDTSATGDFTAEANQSYWLRGSFQVTLPDTADLEVGDRVTFSKALESTPLIIANVGAEIVTAKGASNSVLFDMNAEVTFVFNGTNWEV